MLSPGETDLANFSVNQTDDPAHTKAAPHKHSDVERHGTGSVSHNH